MQSIECTYNRKTKFVRPSELLYVLFSHSAECPNSLWMAMCGDIYSLVISCLYKQSRSGSHILLHMLLKTDACAEFNVIVSRVNFYK